MSGLSAFWNGLDWSVLTDMLMRVLPALVCITLHELAHGYAGNWIASAGIGECHACIGKLAHFGGVAVL